LLSSPEEVNVGLVELIGALGDDAAWFDAATTEETTECKVPICGGAVAIFLLVPYPAVPADNL
jgi:hypothetical protein